MGVGSLKEGLIDQAAAPGVSPLTSAPAKPAALDLSGAKRRRGSERLIGALLFACGSLSVLTTIGIISVLLFETIDFFLDVSPREYFFGTQWSALFRDPVFGVLPLISGTLMIAVIAMVVALPLGVMSALYLSEYSAEGVRDILKPVLEILAGIPTIVYGYFALTFITPHLIKPIAPGTGPFNALSAAVAVGIMILPMVASLSEDAMRAVPQSLRQAAYALGATRLEVSIRIVLPAAISGIFASFILAVSRAIGETMIIVVAAGNMPNLTLDPTKQVQAMTSYIVQVIGGDTERGGIVYRSLFAVGATLFVLTLTLNILSQWFVARYREVYE